MTVIHVMTRWKTLKNGTEVWQCSTCRRKDMIALSGKRYTITPGVRAPHGLLDRVYQYYIKGEDDVRPADRV